ncbi:MAG: hypothetical protein HY816_09355 [Candidatus Wallbacteria bacterium]|nr:hypothetical protein [Candidatus Wallbacteria bacterium]
MPKTQLESIEKVVNELRKTGNQIHLQVFGVDAIEAAGNSVANKVSSKLKNLSTQLTDIANGLGALPRV